MAGFSFLDNLFGRGGKSPRETAKDRLQLVLMHDRADIPAPVMEELRMEIIALVKRRLDIDESQLEVAVERDGNAVALVANIPIRRVRAD
ncbi:MAG: cell division topological specificity factor MinE [Armatimonadaceae bacterium]